MDPRLITYTNTPQVVTQSGSIESNCNAITFINIGTDNVIVMGYTLQQGDQLYLPGNVGEIDVTNYSCSFANAAGEAPALLVIRKIY